MESEAGRGWKGGGDGAERERMERVGGKEGDDAESGEGGEGRHRKRARDLPHRSRGECCRSSSSSSSSSSSNNNIIIITLGKRHVTCLIGLVADAVVAEGGEALRAAQHLRDNGDDGKKLHQGVTSRSKRLYF